METVQYPFPLHNNISLSASSGGPGGPQMNNSTISGVPADPSIPRPAAAQYHTAHHHLSSSTPPHPLGSHMSHPHPGSTPPQSHPNSRVNLNALMNHPSPVPPLPQSHPYNHAGAVMPAELQYPNSHQMPQNGGQVSGQASQSQSVAGSGPAMSIQSLLAVSQHQPMPPQSNDPLAWQAVPGHANRAPSEQSPAKRKRDEPNPNGPHSPTSAPFKIRRMTPPDASSFQNSSSEAPLSLALLSPTNDIPLPAFMTTITCLHASVAQKSYGSEKRFLCPPPVVRISAPVPTDAYDASLAGSVNTLTQWRGCHFAMSINPECSDRSMSYMNQNGTPTGKTGTVTSEQKAMLDQDTMAANFKYLHVGGGTGAATKSKWFQLSLEITNPNPSLGQSSGSSNSHSNHETDLPPSQHLSSSSGGPSGSGPNHGLQPVSIATLLSPPITIISKPSKKTARTRNIASSILDLAHVSLFNRINSQTVRTKYMSVDKEKGTVSASGVGWSAFVIRVIRGPGVSQPAGNEGIESASSVAASSPVATRSSPGAGLSPAVSTLPPQHTAASPASPTTQAPAVSGSSPAPTSGTQTHPQPVHYGSVITLTDPSTNISSDPLIIRKVDKGKVSFDDVGPISQMQKVCLQRWDGGPTNVVQGNARVYLSAANLMYPSNGSGSSQDAESSPNIANASGEPKGGAPHALSYQSPRTGTENRGDATIEVDEVDDFLCWTLVGVSKFQYTFFDGNILTRGHASSSPSNTTSELTTMTSSIPTSPLLPYISNLPSRAITPFPAIFGAPVYRPATQSLELTISNFFTPSSSGGNNQQPQMLPLEIWLADIGPLRYGYPPGSNPGGIAGPGVMGNKGVPILPAGMTMGIPSYSPTTVSTNATIVIEMPSMPEILYTAGIIDRTPGSNSAEGKMDLSTGLSTTTPPSIFVTNTGDSAAPRSLPILFVRPTDRMGYHSGRSVLCENVFAGMNGNGGQSGGAGAVGVGMLTNANGPGGDEWMKAAQAAAASVADGALHGWTLRIV